VQAGLIEVEFIGTKDQLGDILTKALGRLKFQELLSKISLVDICKQHGKN
jgi:hypothetical protein